MGRADLRGRWRAPHEPLFLLAAVWAALVPLVWLAPGLVCDPVAWHLQELVLGVAGAAMGGYLLSAQRHWLKQAGRAASGFALSSVAPPLLVLAWVAGRLLSGTCLPEAASLAGLALFPLGLAACLAQALVVARAWGRLPMALSPLLLVLIALRLRLASDSLTAVLGMALIVAIVGGRIIPAFLAARAGLPADSGARRPLAGLLADLAICLALATHLAGTQAGVAGMLLLLAALGQGLRMARWPLAPGLKGGQADLAVLVIAWCWMPPGLALVGAGLTGLAGLSLSTALHALTMGLMGSMILAVMARAWMRRVPGALRLGPALGAAFVLLQMATVLRLAGAGNPVPAALCWSSGWAIAAAVALAALFRPVPRPVLSARRLSLAPPPSAEDAARLDAPDQ